jgi:hypothetical protein
MRVDYVHQSLPGRRHRFVLGRRQVVDDLQQLVLVLHQPSHGFGYSLGLGRHGRLPIDELQGLDDVRADRLHEGDERIIGGSVCGRCQFQAQRLLACHSGFTCVCCRWQLR